MKEVETPLGSLKEAVAFALEPLVRPLAMRTYVRMPLNPVWLTDGAGAPHKRGCLGVALAMPYSTGHRRSGEASIILA
jgi:hypothetical protein